MAKGGWRQNKSSAYFETGGGNKFLFPAVIITPCMSEKSISKMTGSESPMAQRIWPLEDTQEHAQTCLNFVCIRLHDERKLLSRPMLSSVILPYPPFEKIVMD